MFDNETAGARRAKVELEAKLNGENFFDSELVQLLDGIPKRVYFIFNVGPMDFTVPKGSAGPLGGYRIKACEKGKPYSLPLLIPSIVTDTYLQEDQIKTHSVSGKFMCQDIVRPMNGQMWSIGQNLDDFGVFWTENNPPSNEELELARAKMEKTFRAALHEANMLEAQNRLDLITPIMRHASSWFDEDRKWNQTYKRIIECPNCGESMKAGIAVHSCGAVLNWAKAIAFNSRSLQQAKDAGAWTPELEKEVAALRAAQVGGTRGLAPAGDAGGALVSATELQQFEEPTAQEKAYAEPGKRRTAPAGFDEEMNQELDRQGTPPAATKAASEKKPPKPKRPAGFRE